MAKQIQHPSGASTSPSQTEASQAAPPSSPTNSPSPAPTGPVLTELLGFSEGGYPVVGGVGGSEPLELPTTVVLDADDVGALVLLTFVGGREDQPIITGRVQAPRVPGPHAETSTNTTVARSPLTLDDGPITIEADDRTVTLSVDRELVLRCGKASLRLRRDGFVELRGVDVVSRAARVNWIKGGSVSLN